MCLEYNRKIAATPPHELLNQFSGVCDHCPLRRLRALCCRFEAC